MRNTRTASAAVTMRWLATVKLYGMTPTMFDTVTNMNSENTSGKNFIPSLPALARMVEAMNS